jgi:hypothetical protein
MLRLAVMAKPARWSNQVAFRQFWGEEKNEKKKKGGQFI